VIVSGKSTCGKCSESCGPETLIPYLPHTPAGYTGGPDLTRQGKVLILKPDTA
jgi:hypothetical protein